MMTMDRHSVHTIEAQYSSSTKTLFMIDGTPTKKVDALKYLGGVLERRVMMTEEDEYNDHHPMIMTRFCPFFGDFRQCHYCFGEAIHQV
jgi:hypothetical protein